MCIRDRLIPVLYAALAADYVVGAWGTEHTAYHITLTAPDGDLPFDAVLMAKVAFAGGLFGLTAMVFAELVHGLGRAFRQAVASPLVRPVAGGMLIIAAVLILGTREYLGLGVSSPNAGDVTILSRFDEVFAETTQLWALLGACTIIAVVGVLDDLLDLDWMVKLAAQLAAAGLLAWQGAQIVSLPVGDTLIVGSPTVNFILTVFLMTLVMNAVNFVDGLDGLVAGVAIIANSVFFIYTQLLVAETGVCLLYTSPSPRDRTRSRMPSSA